TKSSGRQNPGAGDSGQPAPRVINITHQCKHSHPMPEHVTARTKTGAELRLRYHRQKPSPCSIPAHVGSGQDGSRPRANALPFPTRQRQPCRENNRDTTLSGPARDEYVSAVANQNESARIDHRESPPSNPPRDE